MCGIAGICKLKSSEPISLDRIQSMVSALHHRGPDETGLFIDDEVGLGHARLSIIDLQHGTQPIHNEDETLWITYNGEIFNYPELTTTLKSRGHVFYTSSDTEMLLHLYEEFGPGFLQHVNGQFALAIWDRRKQALLLARDRMGIRPLYYTTAEGALIFASEIKAIFCHPDVPAQLDPLALDQVFTTWSTLGDRSAFTGIQQLPPGCTLRVTREQHSLHEYWKIPFIPASEQAACSEDALAGEALELLKDAIRIRLRADVPVGSYLSGGLDSSAVASIAKRYFKPDLNTFGIRFSDDTYDEGVFQMMVAGALETAHTESLARDSDVGAAFKQVVQHAETPLLRTAPAPLYLLSRRVQESGMKVVLTGEGADEVFGGYNIFREAKVRAFWARQPSSTWRGALLRRLYPYIFNNPAARLSMESVFSFSHEDIEDPLFSHLVRWRTTSRTKAFFSSALQESLSGYSVFDEIRGNLPPAYPTWDYLCRAQYLEKKIFLSNYLLCSQGDRMAMAHGVEIRLPFLDHRLVTLMGKVPAQWKIRGLNEKYLLKKALVGLLPPEILARSKHPYRAPIAKALLGDDTREETRDILSPNRIRDAGLFDAGKVTKLVERLDHGTSRSEMAGMALAGILSTQLLHQAFVAQRPVNRPATIEPDLVVDRRTGTRGSRQWEGQPDAIRSGTGA